MLQVIAFTYCAAHFLTFGTVFTLGSALLAYRTNPLTFVIAPFAAFCFLVSWQAVRKVRQILQTPFY